MQVRGDYDHGSAVALMAERGGRTAGKWIGGGLVLGSAIATGAQRVGQEMSSANVAVDLAPIAAPIGGLVFLASFVTAPFALIAGAMEGASEAAAYSRRHEAAGRQFEQELREEALEARLAQSVVDTLGDVASAPVQFIAGGRFSPSALLARCGAVVALELEVERVEFEAPSVVEFVARPTLTARYRLTEAAAGRAAASGTAQFTGRYHKFASIEDDGAGSLRHEVLAGIDALSSRIYAALPSTVAWTRPMDTKLAAKPVQTSTLAENLREPLRVHPDLVRPPEAARLAAIRPPIASD